MHHAAFPFFALQHASLPSFCHGPMANSQLVFIWKHQKQPIPDRLPQCMPALAKARLYKMTGPDPVANPRLVFMWKPRKQPIPDRLPQCMPALAKARLYKMTGPDPSMKHKMVFRLIPLHAPCNFPLFLPCSMQLFHLFAMGLWQIPSLFSFGSNSR